MLIRDANPADIASMQALEAQAPTAAHWREREYAAVFAPEAPRRTALVAEGESGQTCGFAIARCGADEWEIENVVVSPQHRRCGIGTELVRDILHAARQAAAGSVLLEVRESNTAARQLYEKLGFVEVGRRPGYYRDPTEDALVLRSSAHLL